MTIAKGNLNRDRIILTLMGAAWLLTVIPSCNEPDCVKSHQRHRVAERSAEIERTHAAFHDPRTRPVPMCALCQAARRDQDDGS